MEKNELKGLYKIPGSLIYTGNNTWSEHEIKFIQYNQDYFQVLKCDAVSDIILDDKMVNWVAVRGIKKQEIIKEIGEAFGIHNMILEDVVDYSEDCKVDFMDGIIFYSLNILNIYNNRDKIISEKVSIIRKDNLVISFHESSNILINKLLERVERKEGYLRQMNSSYLVFAIIDFLIDSYLLEFSKLEDRILKFENKLLDHSREKHLLRKIFILRKQVSDLRRFIWQLREMTKSVNSKNLENDIKIYYKDLFDKSMKLYGLVEGFRDDVATLIELKFSLGNDSMNQIMKTLTIISTIFIPLSFLTGFYGMNFKYMPELAYKFSYPILIIFMVILVIGMLKFFKDRKWF